MRFAAALAVYFGARASWILAQGVVATDDAPLPNVAAQGGIVAAALVVIYYFLRRSDAQTKASTDVRVAELEKLVAELRGRLEGAEQRVTVAETAERAMRADWLKVNADLIQAQAEHLAAMHDLVKEREMNHLLSSQLQKSPQTPGGPS